MASSRIVLVTGGNNGIGYETHILLGSRSVGKGKAAIDSLKRECPDSRNEVDLLRVDVTSDTSIEKAFEQVKTNPGHIDTLINNAGATFDIEYLRGNVSLRESFTKAYDVNVAGANVMTHTFMPLLLKSTDPRLIFVAGLANINRTGKAYFPTPPQPAGWPKKVDFETIGYKCSKLALSMLMLDWNHKMKEDGVKVWSVGPGFLATDLGNMREKAEEMGCGHASEGGAMLRSVVEGKRDADVGKIVVKDGISEW
ncbi:hypothetical protein ACLMJK_009668 [Lecanora helva]